MCLELWEHRKWRDQKGFQKRKARGTETCIGAEVQLPQEMCKDPVKMSSKNIWAMDYK